MIKQLLSSKYRREIAKLNLEIKALEKLKESNPYIYDGIIENYKIRIEHLEAKIVEIEATKLMDVGIIKNFPIKKLFLPSLLILLLIGIFFLRPAIIGYVVEQSSITYRTEINQTFSNSGTYKFDIGNKGILTSLKVSGNAIGQGNIKVYIAKNNRNYTLLDSNSIKEKGVPTITGFVAKEDKGTDKDKEKKDKDKNETFPEKTINDIIKLNETQITNETNQSINVTTPLNESLQNETITNQTINITPTINETINLTQPINKSITINLQYQKNSIYDEDNDGMEDISKITDLTAENSQFNWDVDKAKLCTRWEVYNINEDKATTLCYGNNACCNLINLESSRENWNEPFYSVYGQSGVGLNNIISAQVIYADYSLDVNAPYADIVYSEWANLSTAYNYERIVFKDVCKDTCFLENFNDSSYTIFIEVENSTLQLNEIIYSLLPKIEKYKLKVNVVDKYGQISPIVSVYKDNNFVTSTEKGSLELASDIYDIDVALQNEPIEKITLNDVELKTDSEKNIIFDEIKNNISLEGIEIKKKYAIDSSLIDNAIITATASANSLFKCKDWNYELEVCQGKWEKIKNLNIGEIYNITISKEDPAFIEGNAETIITPILKANKKDFGLDEDIELDFEYLTKEELIRENKWNEEFEVFEEFTNKTEQELKLLKQKIVKKEKQNKKWQTPNEFIETSVFDSEGSLKDFNVELEESREGKFKIKLPKTRAFKAGKYSLRLDLVKDGVTYSQQQDFTWGVLAINLNKSTYLENEDAFISLGVLDDKGRIVCDADITLEITSPANQKTILTTADEEIIKHGECGFLGVTQMPDYFTYYKVDGIGTYAMNLTAVTYNGMRTIVDNFTVASFVDFDIARRAATRIYPLVPYVMNISIIANQNYNGIVNEYVPSSFEISEVEFYEVSEKNEVLSEVTLSAVEGIEIDKDLITKIENVNEKEKMGSRNQADEPKMDFSRSNGNIYKLLYKSFDDLRGWVGEIRQPRLPDKQVSSRSSGFKTQRELRVPDPAHKSIDNVEFLSEEKGFRGLLTLTSLDEIPALAEPGNALAYQTDVLQDEIINTCNKYLNVSFFDETKECKGSRMRVSESLAHMSLAQWIEPLYDARGDAGSNCNNNYINLSNGHNFSVVERARSLMDKAPFWLRGGCEFENGSEISPRSHLYTDKEYESITEERRKKQTRSLDKTTSWLRGVSHEFFLDSEIAESHTVELKEHINYKNVSVLNKLNNKEIKTESQNLEMQSGSAVYPDIDYAKTAKYINISVLGAALSKAGVAEPGNAADLRFYVDKNFTSQSFSGIMQSGFNLLLSQSTASNPSSSTTNSLPLNSLTSANNDDIALTSFSGLGGWITKTIKPENSFGGNIDVLRKSESREISTADFSFASEINLPFTIPFEAYSAENLSPSRNRFTDLGIFSSSRNFGEFDIMLSSDELSSVFKSSRDMLPSDRRVVFQNIFDSFSSSYQLNNIANQNSSAFESRLSMADFAVSNDVLVDFDSHIANDEKGVFKGFGNSLNKKTTLNLKSINENNNKNILNTISNFFSLIPSAQAQANTEPTITTIKDTKIITIPANLKKGKKYVVSYKFDAPDISPEFYLLGPIDIGSFSEARQWQIANDQPSRINASVKGLLVYGENGAATPRYRIWNGTNLSLEGSLPITGPINWTVVKFANKEDEAIAVMTNSSNALLMAVYNGTCWGNGTACNSNSVLVVHTPKVGSLVNSSLRAFDVAYENITGRDDQIAIIAYSNGSNFPVYKRWNSTSKTLSEVKAINNTYRGGQIGWIDLVEMTSNSGADAGANEIALVMRHEGVDDLSAIVWNVTNSSWGCNATLIAGATSLDSANRFKDFGAVYRKQNKSLFVGMSVAATAAIRYANKTLNACDWKVSGNIVTAEIPTVMDVGVDEVNGNNTCVAIQDVGLADNTNLVYLGDGRFSAASPNDAVSLANPGFPRQIVTCGGFGNGTMAVYADASSTAVEIYEYTIKSNTWNPTAAGGLKYTPSPTIGARWQNILRQFPEEQGVDNRTFIIYSDANADLNLQLFNASRGEFASDYSNILGGVAIEATLQSPSTIPFDFAFRRFFAPAPAAPPDTTPPVVNITNINASDTIRINNRLNITAFITGSATTANITFNLTGNNDLYNFSFSLSGATQVISQNITVNVTKGNVINASVVACDAVPNCAINSTLITVANTPAPQATILFPTNDLKTNKQPLDINVTFPADPDGDVINISYYINGVLERNTITNITLTRSDGVYILNVSLFDNVTGASPSANVTVNFTIDTKVPVVNTSLNKSLTNIFQNDIINLTANATDNINLLTGQIIVNASPAGQALIRYFNFSLSGTTAQFSQNITIDCAAGCVINFTARVNDTSNNFRTNDTIITVATPPDLTPPVVNTTFNVSSPAFNDVINFSGNITDNVQLLSANITYNMSGAVTYANYTISGTSASIHNVTAITGCVESCVINFTMYATDTSNNVKQNSTLLAVADRTAPVVNTSFNVTNAVFNDVINFSGNITDGIGLISANITYNMSGVLTKANYTISGTRASIHNITTITGCVETCVINFTMYATDTSNNVKQNSTLITVADRTSPIVNTSLNKSLSNILENDIINLSANTTDLGGLSFGQIIVNASPSGQSLTRYFNFSLSGTKAEFSQNITINCATGCVINFTARTNDTANNFRTNDTIITVAAPAADTTPPSITLDQPINNTNTSLRNITFRFTATDGSGLKNATLFANFSGQFIANQSNQTGLTSGTQATIFVNETIPEGFFIWNIFACDNAGTPNCGFANANFTLRVDRTPPAFSNIKSNVSYYQFYSIQFNTTWTDNNSLFGYIFSINRSGTWFNSSLIRFEDVSSAVSTNISLINDTPGTVLGWQFYANDSAGNLNYTPVQTFMVGGIVWNLSIFNMGTTNQNSANITGSTAIIGYLNNSNVSIGCISGNCSIITTNYTVRDVNDTTNTVYFNCSTLKAGSFEANYSINSTQDYFNSILIVRCTIQTIVTLLSPANATRVDRDRVDDTDANNATLLVQLSNSSAGINVTFKMNLTSPIIAGEVNILVGNATTDALGNANISWNGSDIGGDKMYAGNYTWWVEVNGAQNDTPRYIYVFGGLNLSFRYANLNPNTTYEQGQLVKIEELLKSLGPESPTQINSTYLAKVNTTLTDPTGVNFTIELIDPSVTNDAKEFFIHTAEQSNRKIKSIFNSIINWFHKILNT